MEESKETQEKELQEQKQETSGKIKNYCDSLSEKMNNMDLAQRRRVSIYVLIGGLVLIALSVLVQRLRNNHAAAEKQRQEERAQQQLDSIRTSLDALENDLQRTGHMSEDDRETLDFMKAAKKGNLDD